MHAPLAFVPDTYRMLTLQLPDNSLQTLPAELLPDGWAGLAPPAEARQLIEDWVTGNRFLVLKVPSAVVEGDYNFLINPAHPRAAEVRIIENKPYQFDSRLFGQTR